MKEWLYIEYEYKGRKGSYKTSLFHKPKDQILKEKKAEFAIKGIVFLGCHEA